MAGQFVHETTVKKSRAPAGFISGPHMHDPRDPGVYYSTSVIKKALGARANPGKNSGPRGGWRVIQTTASGRRYAYEGFETYERANAAVVGFAKMDKHIGRKGVSYQVLRVYENPAKLERCVRKVKKRKGVKSAYAVCKAAIAGKTKRRKNPPQHWYIHIQKHGRGPVMLFNGRSFSSPQNAKPEPFTSQNAAMYKARHLLGKYHRQLSAYKIWVSDMFHGAATGKTRVNPHPLQGANPPGIDEAAKKLEDFTGREATHVERAPARSKEKTGLVLGELKAVDYLAAREGIEGGRQVQWHHKFRKDSRPLLAVSTDGKQLHVVGGQYEFTEAGIEDR